MIEHVGIVVVGRNEGGRLMRCLASCRDLAETLVYVDSGSQDGSADRARSLGAHVVELDEDLPFTAARARNAGLDTLVGILPDVEMIQFIDGDCELSSSWLRLGSHFLAEHPEVAAVSGRRREQHADASRYNRITDIEWNLPIGEGRTCGGDVLVRVSAVLEIGGYDPSLIAGEEIDLSIRLRQHGYRIWRLNADMTVHDAAIDRFGQWWRRQVRSGHAYAQLLHRHGDREDTYWRRRVASILVWGGAFPVLSLLLAWPTRGASLLLFAIAELFLWVRVARANLRENKHRGDGALFGIAVVLGKLPQFQGAIRFYWNHIFRRRSTRLIEYKMNTR